MHRIYNEIIYARAKMINLGTWVVYVYTTLVLKTIQITIKSVKAECIYDFIIFAYRI